MSRLSVTPEQFTLVKFDSARLLALAEEAAAGVGFPHDVDVSIEVDEVLPSPLAGSQADLVDGNVALWFTGGAFEDPRHQGHLEADHARAELGAALLRARDRLSGGFADAPVDEELTERQRAIWDVYAEGRLARLGGFLVREPRRHYSYRLSCGFNDVADAEYARLWQAEALSWLDVLELESRLEAVDPRERKGRTPVRRVSLRQTS